MRARVQSAALMLALAIDLGTVVSATEIGQLLQQNAIVPVDPPQAAVDFTLPRLEGGDGSLSDFHGQWVLLTFWASWCGPCRSEMPTLQDLHEQRQASGLAVVGVSLDSQRQLAASFLEELDVDFPQFWDEQGRVGADYRASAIPLSYLIDPSGRVVGVSRGARDWSRLGPMVDGLLADSSSVDGGAGTVYSQASSLELPRVLDPPTAEVNLVETSPRVGESFHVDVRMRWVGTLEEYLPQPPKMRLPEGVAIDDIVASTDSRDDGKVVTYRLTLTADRAGSFALDPVELRYIPRSTGSPVVALAEGPTVEVQAPGLEAVEPGHLALAGGGLLLVVAAAWLFYRRRRTLGRFAPDPTPERYQALRARFDDSRSLRMQGRWRELALVLSELELELAGEDGQERQRWSGLIETLRFGDQVPTGAELESLQRSVERKIEGLRPDPDAALRSRLRMTKETS